MKTLYVLFFIIGSGLLFSCRDKPVDQIETQKSVEKKNGIITPVEFSPPKDSSITSKQLAHWNECNQLLDSLTFRYADSFKVEDPVSILRYQEDFINAQDKICVKAGLPGGYREYTWILQNMGFEKNRPLLESVNAQSF